MENTPIFNKRKKDYNTKNKKTLLEKIKKEIESVNQKEKVEQKKLSEE